MKEENRFIHVENKLVVNRELISTSQEKEKRWNKIYDLF